MEPTRQHILVVDDDARLRALLAEYLTREGYAMVTVGDGKEMRESLAAGRPDLIILDLMLPGEDGLSLLRELRTVGNLPVIMLSARGEDIDRIVGLEVGADDYLAKPFNPRELLARIKAVLRRGAAMPAGQTAGYAFGDFLYDPASRVLSRNGGEVALTSAELALLDVFVTHPNQALSRDWLVDQLKGYTRTPYDRSVDVRVTRLRRKVESDPAAPRYIRTVWAYGYKFTPGGQEGQ